MSKDDPKLAPDELPRLMKREHLGPPFSPEAQKVADAFFAHKAENPEPVPYEELTPLQKRMQSGLGD